MQQVASFLSSLRASFESQSLETLEKINRFGGLEVCDLLELVAKPKDFSAHRPYDVDESTLGNVDVIDPEACVSGVEAYRSGQAAFCILAGGAGTRIGRSKPLLNIPGTDETLLSLKLRQARDAAHVWIMTSPNNHDEIVEYVNRECRDIAHDRVKFFQQYESVRLTVDNQLYLEDGMPSFYPCGHGDVIPALVNSGILGDFLRDGGLRVHVSNVDNVAARPDPRIMGHHIKNKSFVTCEVVEKKIGESGGVLCSHNGIDQIVEAFRLDHAHPDEFRWLNTNTMIFEAGLPFDTLKPSWHRVKKNINGRLLVQYERLLQDLTATFKTSYVRVDRAERFIPVKTQDDLQMVARIFENMTP